MFYRYQPRFFDAFRRAMAAPPNTAYPRLSAWAARTEALVRGVYAASDAAGVDGAARRALALHLDKRDVNMETILATIRFHAAQEYPHLLRQESEEHVLTVQAINLNDRYLILRLSEETSLQSEPLRSRLLALRDHLNAMPGSSE